jgi:L-rhamnose-H+ transport protein
MNVILGAFLAVIGGAVNGMFALPMKLAKKWSWENVWLPFSALALVIFPYLVATMGAPQLAAAYANAEPTSIVTGLLMGVGAYAGSLLFGISLGLIGNSLAFSLLVGSMSAVGVLGPMLLFHPEKLVTLGGRWIDLGILFMFTALVVCARAGSLMGKAKGAGSPQKSGGSVVVKGMLLAIAGGVLSGLLPMGLSMSWARDIAASAVHFGGAGQAAAQNVVLLPVLVGGALPNCLYAAWLLLKNKTYPAYKGSYSYWLIILLMGIMYTGSTVMWGMSSSPSLLGTLGPSVGWALFIGGLVVSSNIGGFATGEWKGAGSKALTLMICGVLIMVVAATCIGYGNYRLN